jgi:type IV secretory pathway TraG/TraD family ATPase VirD4
MYKRDFFGNISDVTHDHRPLATLDEIKAIFKNEFILFTGDNPPVRVPKQPYWKNPALHINGKPIYDANPYIDGSK